MASECANSENTDTDFTGSDGAGEPCAENNGAQSDGDILDGTKKNVVTKMRSSRKQRHVESAVQVFTLSIATSMALKPWNLC